MTSSDKLSALPSHLRSSPAGLPAAVGTRVNKSNSSSAEDTPLELPSTTSTTPETRFIRPSNLSRGAQQISYSVSDSAPEFGTPQRRRISFDNDRESSTSPRPSESAMTHISPFPVTCSWTDANNLQMTVHYPHPASQSSLAPTGPLLVLS